MTRRVFGVLVACFGLSMGVFTWVQSSPDRVMIPLPGTQPGHVSPADSFQRCTPCHQDIVRQWSGSTMAHAPRDPIFNALLAITNKRTLPLGLDVAEYCLRCHSPSGWLAGRSHELSVQSLVGTDLDGVHCDFCHRAVDPLAPPPEAPVSGTVPGYGNGMYVVVPTGEPRRGTRNSTPAGHPAFYEPFLGSSEFCGTCHDVSNPYFASSPSTTAPHLQPPLERTYTEWKLSWYATQGRAGSCQSCHMPREQGYASSQAGSRFRLDVAIHDFSGVNTFVPSILHNFWPTVDTFALANGKARSQAMKERAAMLDVAAGRSGNAVVALVRITNLTGHKLPTGFAEGRRMWIHLVGKDENGVVLFESGAYNEATADIAGDPAVKVYEAKLGPSSSASAFSGLPMGASYHVGLSDSVYFDNRIPPRGYQHVEFEEHRAAPAGYHYEDGQFWDITRFVMPSEVRAVEASLRFQLVSREFAEFLRDENIDNPYDWNQWGERLYQSWSERGMPVTMVSQRASVQSAEPVLPPVHQKEIPLRFLLAQNYPNPFNASTTIEFWLSAPAFITLSIFDLNGRLVQTLVNDELEAGLHVSRFGSAEAATGMYLYRLDTGNSRVTKKLVLLK